MIDMKPYVTTNLGKLYCANVLKILPKIHRRAKLLFVDLPYRIAGLDREGYLDFVGQVVSYFDKLTLKSGYIIVINNPHNMFFIAPMLQKYKFINEISLIKLNPHQEQGRFAFSHNVAWILSRRKQLLDNVDGIPDVMNVKMGYSLDDIKHPAALPEDLVETIVKATTSEGDLVIDLFAGSGTVEVVCERLNRPWIAVEIKPEYCDMIFRRLIE